MLAGVWMVTDMKKRSVVNNFSLFFCDFLAYLSMTKQKGWHWPSSSSSLALGRGAAVAEEGRVRPAKWPRGAECVDPHGRFQKHWRSASAGLNFSWLVADSRVHGCVKLAEI